MNIFFEDLIIRDIKMDDLDAVHDFASIEEVCRYQAWGPNTLEETKDFIAAAVDEIHNLPRINYNSIVTKTDGTVLGTCGIYLKGNEAAEIGFTLKKEFWGKGIGTKVALALIGYAVHDLNQNLVIATCDVLNEGSNALLRKVGFKLIRIINQHMNIRGRVRDTAYYEYL